MNTTDTQTTTTRYNLTQAVEVADPTLKRSAKKVNAAATENGWRAEYSQTVYSSGTEGPLTIHLFPTNPEAWAQLQLRDSRRSVYTVPERVDASFDADTGSWYGAAVVYPEGSNGFGPGFHTVTELADWLSFPARRLAADAAQAEREQESARQYSEAKSQRDEYVAQLENRNAGFDSGAYGWHRLKGAAATPMAEAIDVPGRWDAGDVLRAAASYAEAMCTVQLATDAMKQVGWPNEAGQPTTPGEAITKTVLRALGSHTYRGAEAQLNEAASKLTNRVAL